MRESSISPGRELPPAPGHGPIAFPRGACLAHAPAALSPRPVSEETVAMSGRFRVVVASRGDMVIPT